MKADGVIVAGMSWQQQHQMRRWRSPRGPQHDQVEPELGPQGRGTGKYAKLVEPRLNEEDRAPRAR